MTAMNLAMLGSESLTRRADELFEQQQQKNFKQIDRLFAVLMIVQWLAGIAFACLVSPRQWAGQYSSLHPHLYAAVFLGAALSALPVGLALYRPGRFSTRAVIAVAQMLWSALLIHLTGGRIETHFHVFGSLAFLAFYRDWRVLVPATIVVALDHLIRGIVLPQSVYGVLTASPWRSMEHAAWVIFEDVILVLSCVRGVREMRLVAEREAQLRESEEELRLQKSLLESQSEAAIEGILVVSTEGKILSFNRRFVEMWEIPGALIERGSDNEALKSVQDKLVDPEEFLAGVTYLYQHPDQISREEIRLKDGRVFDRYSAPVKNAEAGFYGRVWFFQDITERKRAESEREELHRRLLESSRQAGMAEVATGVLHNVGNVLNSVNVSATVAADKLRGSKVANLSRAAALLNEHAADLAGFVTTDEKGKQLPAYLMKLAEHLGKEQEEVLDELASLSSNVEHIKQVVSMQQSYARVAGVTEMIAAQDLVEEAVRLNLAAFDRHHIQVSREYAQLPLLMVDKHKALQILVNLVSNVRHALDGNALSNRRVTLRTCLSQTDPKRMCIQVIDNGMGITPQNLTKVFSHGFTTRKDGHGFGLHSAALTAKALSGSLTVHSDGPGTGATFTLELPLALAEVKT